MAAITGTDTLGRVVDRPLGRLPIAGVRWGDPQALADTLADHAGCEVVLLEEFDDVDSGADLRVWSEREQRQA